MALQICFFDRYLPRICAQLDLFLNGKSTRNLKLRALMAIRSYQRGQEQSDDLSKKVFSLPLIRQQLILDISNIRKSLIRLLLSGCRSLGFSLGVPFTQPVAYWIRLLLLKLLIMPFLSTSSLIQVSFVRLLDFLVDESLVNLVIKYNFKVTF